MDDIDLATAETVRRAIRKARLTQTAVAKAANIPPSTWRRRMHGSRSFHLSELVKIARTLGVHAGELVDEIWERAA